VTPGRLRGKVIAERVSWIRRMLDGLKALPRQTYEEFAADQRTVAAAESYLRRGLEALLDLGRHILAKGFGRGVTEYKEIPAALAEQGVLGREAADLLREMAGYRNRLVHFYDEVSARELYEICTVRLGDIERVLSGLVAWIDARPDLIDRP
jgi:uncharacterized protein YutE (UPF0331/DUF86 family)